jgi:hypothetical protein
MSQPVRHHPAVFLAAVLDRDGAQDQGREDEHHGQVEAREDGRVNDRECSEQRPTGGYQPDLVAVPDRADGVEHLAALEIRPGHVHVHDPGPEVEAVEQGVAAE